MGFYFFDLIFFLVYMGIDIAVLSIFFYSKFQKTNMNVNQANGAISTG